MRWCIPEGAVFRLWEDKEPCSGSYLDLVGDGTLHGISDLDSVGFGDKASCAQWLGGPFARAGEDQTVECAGSTTAVQLDGRASIRLEGSALAFLWEAAGVSFDAPHSSTSTGSFHLGATPVTWTVSNAVGADSDAVTVRVVDTIAPTIACPGNVVANATMAAGVAVNYSAPTASDSCGIASLIGVPTSGSIFSVGTTIVQCTVTDAAGHTASCSFTVKVKSPADQIGDLITKVNRLPGVNASMKNSLMVKLQDAQAALAAGKQMATCGKLLDFISEVKAQLGKKQLTEAQATDLIADATRIRGAVGCP